MEQDLTLFGVEPFWQSKKLIYFLVLKYKERIRRRTGRDITKSGECQTFVVFRLMAVSSVICRMRSS